MYKVLVFGMTENPGGVESFLLNYYRHIDRKKIQFDFLNNSYERVAYEDKLIAMGGKTYYITARSQNPSKYKEELENFFANNAQKYNAIWVNVCSLANIDYLKMAKKYNIKRRIIHSHNSQNMDSKLRAILHYVNKRLLSKYATDFWACSEEAARWFYNGKLLKQAIIVHNAIDISAMEFKRDERDEKRTILGWNDKYIIGNIGRLHFQKNQMFAIDIFKELIKKEPNARLVFIGQGEDEEKLKSRVRSEGLDEYIRFAGLQYDISAWLSAMDLFLFPSAFEGLPIAPLEAQSNGVMILASTNAIPKEAVLNGNVRLEQLESSAASWCEDILDMKKNSYREGKSQIKENFVTNGYDIETEVKKIEQLFLR